MPGTVRSALMALFIRRSAHGGAVLDVDELGFVVTVTTLCTYGPPSVRLANAPHPLRSSADTPASSRPNRRGAGGTRQELLWEWIVLTSQALRAVPIEVVEEELHTVPPWMRTADVANATVPAADFRLFVQGAAQAGLRVHQLLKTAPGPLEPATDAFVTMLLSQGSFSGGRRRSSVVDLVEAVGGAAHPHTHPEPAEAVVPATVTRHAASLWLARASMLLKLIDAVTLFTFMQRDELLHDEFEVRRLRNALIRACGATDKLPLSKPCLGRLADVDARPARARAPRPCRPRATSLANRAPRRRCC